MRTSSGWSTPGSGVGGLIARLRTCRRRGLRRRRRLRPGRGGRARLLRRRLRGGGALRRGRGTRGRLRRSRLAASTGGGSFVASTGGGSLVASTGGGRFAGRRVPNRRFRGSRVLRRGRLAASTGAGRLAASTGAGRISRRRLLRRRLYWRRVLHHCLGGRRILRGRLGRRRRLGRRGFLTRRLRGRRILGSLRARRLGRARRLSRLRAGRRLAAFAAFAVAAFAAGAVFAVAFLPAVFVAAVEPVFAPFFGAVPADAVFAVPRLFFAVAGATFVAAVRVFVPLPVAPATDVDFRAFEPADLPDAALPVAGFLAAPVAALRTAPDRSAIASPTCKTARGRRRALRGWQEYGTYRRPTTCRTVTTHFRPPPGHRNRRKRIYHLIVLCRPSRRTSGRADRAG